MRPSRGPRQPLPRVAAAIACLLLVTASIPGSITAASKTHGNDSSWIVLLDSGARLAAAKSQARAAGASTGHTYRHAVNGFQFTGSAAAAAAMARNPNVRLVTPDYAVTLTETLPFGVKRIDAHVPGSPDGAYQNGYRGAGARIAIIDTGIDLDHPDLAASMDPAGGKNCLAPGTPPNDGHGHGTHVSGTAAAPLNGNGVVGVAPEAQLVPVKVFDDAGNSAESLVLCGLDYVTGLNTDADPANDVDVASMSFGESRAWGDLRQRCPARRRSARRPRPASCSSAAPATPPPTPGPSCRPRSPRSSASPAIADFDGNRAARLAAGSCSTSSLVRVRRHVRGLQQLRARST